MNRIIQFLIALFLASCGSANNEKLSVNHPDAGKTTFTYDAAGNMLTKFTAQLKKSISDKAPIAYTYDDKRERLQNMTLTAGGSAIMQNKYQYDAVDNILGITNDADNTERQMYWDEENRLMVLSDNGKTSRYTYNAAGERVVKSHGTMDGVYINGTSRKIKMYTTNQVGALLFFLRNTSIGDNYAKR